LLWSKTYVFLFLVERTSRISVPIFEPRLKLRYKTANSNDYFLEDHFELFTIDVKSRSRCVKLRLLHKIISQQQILEYVSGGKDELWLEIGICVRFYLFCYVLLNFTQLTVVCAYLSSQQFAFLLKDV
jgi:hypothetical protein